MSKHKQAFIGKHSKASLKSRGLSTNNPQRQRNSLVSNGCYSLYSTDSEETVSVVNRGLDKCAELLTNILEIKSEAKDMKKCTNAKQRLQRPNKREKSAPRSKSGIEQGVRRLKPKSAIQIPTGGPENGKKLRTAYNEKVVASTPVITSEQRRKLQELQKRENSLKQQIQLLQEEYENLQGHSPQATKEALIPDDDRTNDLKSRETKSSRRSLDFSNNAEKPFVDNPQIERNALVQDSPAHEPEKSRKVHFVSKTSEPKDNSSENLSTDSNKREENNPSSSKEERPAIDSTGQTSKRDPVAVIEDAGKVSTTFQSPQRYADHLRILAYLVGELRAVLASSGENEVERLLNEIEGEIRLLSSYTMQSPRQLTAVKVKLKKQHDIDTEIALQPLRSENSDLRRKLRIANQRGREMEEQLQRATKKERPGEEGIVEQLHKQLCLEREKVEQLRRHNEQAEKVIAQREKDTSSLQDQMAEKEEELENLHNELLRHRSKNTDTDYHCKRQLESLEITIHAKNKEADLLKLAIEQRDAEIERLTELTRGLQQSLARVLSNVQALHPEDVLLSDTSMLSGLDTWKPRREPNLMPSMVSTAARLSTHQPQESKIHSDEELDVRTLETSNRDYHDGQSGGQGRPYRKETVDQDSVNEDDTTLSVSSTDEFVFKQELANLDAIIARLQCNLRNK